MKIRFTFLLLIGMLAFAACESNKAMPGITLIPCQLQDSLWGFVDLGGNVVIKPAFETEPTYFREGFALIKKANGRFDYIDETGKLMNKNYLYATYFSEGKALVTEENSYPVFIDKNFKTLIEMKNAQEVGAYSDGLARFKKFNQMWGFINESGNEVLPAIYDHAESFSDGLALVEAKDSSLVPYKAFIDTKGNILAKLDYDKYSKIRNFSDGMAAFFDGTGWGFFDNKGSVAIKPVTKWSTVTDFKNGYASVQTDGKWGIIDKTGKLILPQTLVYPCMFYNDLGAVMKDNKVGFIDIKGTESIKPQFDDLVLPFLGENAIVKQGTEFIFINKEGKPVGTTKMKNVARNFYLVTAIGELVRNDYFNIAKVISILVKDINQSSVNGLAAGAGFDEVVSKAGLTGQLKFNAFDSTYVISRAGSIDNYMEYSINYKFKAEGTKYRLKALVFTIKMNLGFAEKTITIKDAIVEKLTKEGFQSRKTDRNIVMDSPNSVAFFEMIGPRMVFRFDFKSI